MNKYAFDPVVRKYIRAIKQRLYTYGWTNYSEHCISVLVSACKERTGHEIDVYFDYELQFDDWGNGYYAILIEDEEIHVYEY